MLDYDAEAHTLTASDHAGMFLNCGPYNTFGLFDHLQIGFPSFTYFVDKPAVPADPRILDFCLEDYYENDGFWLEAEVLKQDVNGEYIAASDLSYIIWDANGDYVDRYCFTTDDYQIAEDMDMVPYNFTAYDANGLYTIKPAARLVYVFDPFCTNLGIQVVCTSGGEVNKSNVVWALSGVNAISEVTSTMSARFYSVDGQEHTLPQQGINLVRTDRGTARKVFVR